MKKAWALLVFLGLLCSSCDIFNNLFGSGDDGGGNTTPVVEYDKFYINYGEPQTTNREVFLRADVKNAVRMRFSNEPIVSTQGETRAVTLVQPAASKATRRAVASRAFVVQPIAIQTNSASALAQASILQSAFSSAALQSVLTMPVLTVEQGTAGASTSDSKFANTTLTTAATPINPWDKLKICSPSIFNALSAAGLAQGWFVKELSVAATTGELAASELTKWVPYADRYNDWVLPAGRGDCVVYAEFEKADGTIVQTYNKIFLDVQDMQEINYGLQHLGDGTTALSEKDAEMKDTDTGVEGDYVVAKTEYHAQPGFDMFAVTNPAIQAIYPGSVIDAESIYTGEYSMITAPRTPQTLSITLENLNGGSTYQTPYGDYGYSDWTAAFDKLKSRVTDETINAPDMTMDVNFFNSQKDFGFGLGVDVVYSDYGGSADFHYASNEVKTRGTMSFVQRYYTVVADLPNTPAQLWQSSVKFDDLGLTSKMTPAIIDSVNYGRVLYLNFESSHEQKEVEAALKFCYDPAGSNKVEVDTSLAYKNIVDNLAISAYVKGGDQKLTCPDGFNINGYEDLKTFFNQYVAGSLVYSKSTYAVPLSYTVRQLRTGFPVGNVVMATDYTIRNTKKKSNRFEISLKALYCTANNDGGEKGKEELMPQITVEAYRVMKGSTQAEKISPETSSNQDERIVWITEQNNSLSSISASTDADLYVRDLTKLNTDNAYFYDSTNVRRYNLTQPNVTVSGFDDAGEPIWLNDIDFEQSYFKISMILREDDTSGSEDGVDDVFNQGQWVSIGTQVIQPVVLYVPMNRALGLHHLLVGSTGGSGDGTGAIALFKIEPITE